MPKISGLRAIYEPTGAAREYGALAVNLFNGCTCGCKYCYVPGLKRTSREAFRAKVTVQKDILRRIAHDAVVLQERGNAEPVFLCFTCDPCEPGLEAWLKQALHSLTSRGQKVLLLTKRPSMLLDNPALLARLAASGSTLGVTLTLMRGWKNWEPGADTPERRILALIMAKQQGIRTVVSLEPVLDLYQGLEIIRATSPYVDHYGVGKPSGLPLVCVDWPRFRAMAEALLKGLGKSYLIKKSLRGAT